MVYLRLPGAYPWDVGTEDEVFSEDDGENWEGKRPEDLEFHLTPKDIALVRHMFPRLPPELVTQILDLAEYWAYSQNTCSDFARFHNANTRYLRSEPIRGGEFTYPLRRLVVTTDSRDQGWSSYPESHGTRKNSWTWFELTLDDGETNDEIVRVEVMRNIHAGSIFEKHQAVIEDGRILRQARKGDRLSVWVRAMHPGWCNHVQSVKIEVWSAC
ncbi:hypothetical protein BDM02DRAFT_3188152 [Thelephora ganbajun]|uniref:Uncharacterized protein n=1 Tax=Thelephora ganbajun TaxID=370292 RepID=A0ACB6ZCA7_THEGA|nr:hypothetical protein BDM02DRAFT_3188152 [Thelephora ganbajun]